MITYTWVIWELSKGQIPGARAVCGTIVSSEVPSRVPSSVAATLMKAYSAIRVATAADFISSGLDVPAELAPVPVASVTTKAAIEAEIAADQQKLAAIEEAPQAQ